MAVKLVYVASVLMLVVLLNVNFCHNKGVANVALALGLGDLLGLNVSLGGDINTPKIPPLGGEIPVQSNDTYISQVTTAALNDLKQKGFVNANCTQTITPTNATVQTVVGRTYNLNYVIPADCSSTNATRNCKSTVFVPPVFTTAISVSASACA